ncbi:hypothetical protein C8R47DRAFT_1211446 [Mycena vitilis]|nr:hypothetical protein C8R47DRAFT_1211446 [Mycena vitilis]
MRCEFGTHRVITASLSHNVKQASAVSLIPITGLVLLLVQDLMAELFSLQH